MALGGKLVNLDGLKVVGDAVGDLKSAFSDAVSLSHNFDLKWEQGGYANNGTTNSNANRIRTPYFEKPAGVTSMYLTVGTGYLANVISYDASGAWKAASGWVGSTTMTLSDRSGWKIAVKRTPDSDEAMSTSEGANITMAYSTELLDKIEEIETDLATDIPEQNAKINKINADYYVPNYDTGTPVTVTLTDSKYWDISGATATLSSHASFKASNEIAVQPGESYKISGHSGGSNKVSLWAIVNADYGILSYGKKSTSQYDDTAKITVPENGKYLIITVISGYTATVIKAADAPIINPLYDKTVALIGDSISTNGNSGTDANVPEITITSDDVGVELSAYLTYYDVQAGLSINGTTYTSSDIGNEVMFTPAAGDVGKSIGLPNNFNDNSVTTWWEVMQGKLNCTFIPNVWSGASITSHEGGTSQYKTSYAWHEATIRKCGIRTPGAMTRTAPDVIIIYRGANDMTHPNASPFVPDVVLTEDYFDNYNWQYPENDAVTGGYGYKEGLCLTIKKLRDAYPNAKIFLCTLNVFKRVNYSHFPTNNGVNSLPQYNDAIREVADFMGCGLIEFDKDGITFENCYAEGYLNNDSGQPTHPTDKGHEVMGLKAITDMKAQYSEMN